MNLLPRVQQQEWPEAHKSTIRSTRSSKLSEEQYFQQQVQSNLEFWRRFGMQPRFEGLRVLEVGCGHGALSIQMASLGADVVGIDIDPARVAFACNKVVNDYSELADRVSFINSDLETLPRDYMFDLVVSKDTFEHIQRIDQILPSIHSRLRPGGRLYAGFGPLYHSPYGDHGRTGMLIPWAHAILPQSVVLARAGGYQRRKIQSLYDLGLNGLTADEFLRIISQTSFALECVRFNQGGKRLLRILSTVRTVRPLARFATVSIYAVLVAS